MNRFFRKVLIALCILLSAFCILHSLPAFPGAEGWGADTPGGRGGKVYVVTNTNSFGPGSFNEAFQAAGPRIIVFRVSGVINVNPTTQFYMNRNRDNSFLTIAGQTSPGGITLISSKSGSSIMFCYHDKFHDGVFRFIRFRATASNMDAFTFAEGSSMVFDHCDFSGGNDETHDVGYSHHFTVQWSTVTNSSAGQTYGSLMQRSDHISIHHSLYAHHTYRGGPLIHWGPDPIHPDENGLIDYRNNVCYNATTLMLTIDKGVAPIWVNAVGNTFKMGPNQSNQTHNMVKIANATTYSSDNCYIEKSGLERCNLLDSNIASGRWGGGLASGPWPLPPVTTQPRDSAYNLVLDKAGAWPRDPMDLRTFNEVRTGTGQLRKDNDPLITSGPAAPADADMDGMPDCWETTMGLDPNDPADNTGDLDGDGYTNIEEYINDMALALTGDVPQNCMLEGGCPTAVERGRARAGGAMTVTVSPNPFKTWVKINYELQITNYELKQIHLAIYDINGKRITNFIDKIHHSSFIICNSFSWDATGLPSGIYLLKATAAGKTVTKRLFLQK